MTNDVQKSADGYDGSVDSVSMEDAFMDIPDAENEAITDARTTALITLISTAVFIAIVFIFIL